MFVSAPARMWKRRPQVGAMRMYDKELRGANARHARSPRMSRHRILKASFSRGAAHFPRHQCCGRAGLSAASPTREISSRLSSSWTMVFSHAWMGRRRGETPSRLGRSLWRGAVLPNDEVAHCRAFQSPSRPEASQTRGLGRMPAKMGLLRTCPWTRSLCRVTKERRGIADGRKTEKQGDFCSPDAEARVNTSQFGASFVVG